MEIVRENELSDKVVVLHGRIEVHVSCHFFAILSLFAYTQIFIEFL
jgi:hypothetical protein